MTYNVGDIAYADFSRYGRIDVRKGKVTKISETGVIRIMFPSFNLSFLSNGIERAGDRYHPAMLITKEQYEAKLHEQIERSRIDRFNAFVGHTKLEYGYANHDAVVLRLKTLLEQLKGMKDATQSD